MRWPDLGAGNWSRRGRLAYLRPIDWVVHGVLAEKSGTPSSVYVWQVAMPLTVPTEVLVLSWSDRVGGGTLTYPEGSAEADEALVEAATRARRLHQESPILVDPPGGVDNVGMQEARAFGLLVSGDTAGAREVLTRVLQHRPTYDWERRLIERAESVKNLVDRSDLDSDLDLIRRWRAGSLDALRLDE